MEPLLNSSANRWRFSHCLYEIKESIPIKKDISPRVLLAFISPSPSLAVFISLIYSLCFFLVVILRLASGLGKGKPLLKVEWTVVRY